MPQTDQTLAAAAYDLAEEYRSGLWNHVSDMKRLPAPLCPELIAELQRRCPGRSASACQQAIADGLFASR
ncbi:hypothetical protein [Prosthecobacter sp.]|uniref:hypothetical protein n=1 Tax=Prosthecobacter sp. TaxID=1965333 RepID=UPI003782EAEA